LNGARIVETAHEKIHVIHADALIDAHGGRDKFNTWLTKGLDGLYDLATAHDAAAIRNKLVELVPEYTPGTTPGIL